MHFVKHLSGSIVALRREVTPAKMQYLHTGVLPCRKTGEPYIMELQREPGLHGVAQVDITPAREVLERGRNPPGATMSVRNTHLERRGIDIAKTLYRFSRIAGKTIDYHVETLNCDVMSTLLVSGDPVWFHKTTESDLAFLVKDFVPSKGVITLSKLYEVEYDLARSDT